MKHAVLIMAHKNLEQLCHLVEYFSRECYVFIHIDKKWKLTSEERAKLEAFPWVVKVYRKYKINWGGYNILRCEVFMLREVLKRCDAEYVHLISGQDYPTMTLAEFLFFFELHKGKDCLQYIHLPQMNWERNTFTRFQYYYPYDWFDVKAGGSRKLHKLLHFQREYHIKRSLPKQFDHLYGSSQWFSITRTSAQMVVDYTRRHPRLYWRMWMTFAPEESYIATVLVNLKHGRDVLFTNFRFIRWKMENGNCPANLDLHHLKYILAGEYVFARKLELPVSAELIQCLDKYLVQDVRPLKGMENGGWDYDGYRIYGYDEWFTTLVQKLCQFTGVDSVLDAGCGCGLYVAMLRDRKIAASGFDANPYTEELSKRLIDEEQEPCVQADLLDNELEAESPFGLVYCKDVLSYLPKEHIGKAMQNLAKFSDRYILLNWQEKEMASVLPITYYNEQTIDTMMAEVGFVPDQLLNRQIKKSHNECQTYKLFVRL